MRVISFGRRDPLGRAGRRGEGGRRARAYPDGKRQDARHHRRSAAGGGLFEARRPKDHAIIAEIDGTIKFGRDYKNKRRIIHRAGGGRRRSAASLIPKGKPFHLQEGDTIEKGDYILEGIPARTTSWRSRASRRLPPISSTRSRTSTGCRA